MKKIASLVLLGLLSPCLLFSQGETSNWFFGQQAGIRFNNDGSVTPINDSQINTFEGCATISDSVGNLLFYTDGITVYNRNNQIMDNGVNLYGDPSSTQSALIVPAPEDPNLFYIFTVDTSTFENDPDFGLNYSIVDITRDEGLGAVTVKNVNLLQDCSEKITAVIKDCFDQSIWVVTLASENGEDGLINTFYAFEVNTSGVSGIPVKTTFPDFEIQDPRGYLKFSPDASKIAAANVADGLILFEFDKNSGQVSNPERIDFTGTNIDPYGLEFSPNSQLLYVLAYNESQLEETHQTSLWQVNLNAADLNSSVVELDNQPIYRGALQQGINGKIYRTIALSYQEGTSFLGVIENPNEVGAAAGYKHNAVYLGGNKAMQGLPPFIQSLFSTTPLVRNPDGTTSNTLSLCSGEPLRLEADSIPSASYAWEKDGIPLVGTDTHTLTIPASSVTDSGRYRVVITPVNPEECPTIGESLINIVALPEASLEYSQCDVGPDDSSDGITLLNLNRINEDPELTFFFYETLQDRDMDNPIPESENYQNTQPFNQVLYYKVVNSLGCANFGELNLVVTPSSIDASAFSPAYTCDEVPEDSRMTGLFDLEALINLYGAPMTRVELYREIEDAVLQKNQIDEPVFTSESTTLYIRLSEGGICRGIESLELVVNATPSPAMKDTYVFCADRGSLTLEGPIGYDSYTWLKITPSGTAELGNGRVMTLSEPGMYELETAYIYAAQDGPLVCSNSVGFQVIPSEKADISEIEILDFSENNTVEISVMGGGRYEYSLDGLIYQDNPYFSNIPSGFYTAYVRDKEGCGISSKEIAVMGYPKFFTPNGDGINDLWHLSGINELFQPGAFIGIFDRYGTFVAQVPVGDRGWDGTANARNMPADDYWFRVQLKDGREIQGHFALKR